MTYHPASEQFTPKLFTILKNGYSVSDFRADILAGLTVAIVALPLAMAFAIASGTSPDKGLVTAVIAGFLISFLGGSRVQIGGPTGAFVVVVFGVIANHGYDGLVLATLIAGAMLVVAGYCRLGIIIKYVPLSVITGFTTGIAVIIASTQVKDFFGLRIEKPPAEFIEKWISYFEHIGSFNIFAIMLGVIALVIIITLRRIDIRIPFYVIAIALVAIIAVLFHLPVETIGSRFGGIPSGLPMPEWPEFTTAKLIEILPSACIIAFLAGIEALLSAMVADGMTGFNHRSNQELVGQGVANMASALFGGMPATGAIARTATNIKSGARTPMAGMFHALFLLLFMVVAADIMVYVPMAALAAVLFVVCWGMSEMHKFTAFCRARNTDTIILLATFSLTVLVDLTVGIAAGVVLALVLSRFQTRNP